MELKGTHTFASASPQQVWNALHNSAVLQACVPNVDSIAWQGDNAIAISGGFGPIKGSGVAQVTEQTPPSHMKIVVNRTQVNASLVVDMAPSGAGTLLTYSADVNANGPLSAGLAMAKGMVEGQLNQFFNKLEGQI
jgi:carbon monoxide dehydrogenase subunit G